MQIPVSQSQFVRLGVRAEVLVAGHGCRVRLGQVRHHHPYSVIRLSIILFGNLQQKALPPFVRGDRSVSGACRIHTGAKGEFNEGRGTCDGHVLFVIRIVHRRKIPDMNHTSYNSDSLIP